MWKKDGSRQEMHFFLTKEGDEVMGKKPFTKEPEKEFRLKVSDFVKVVKGYENDTPFNKPKGWFTKSTLSLVIIYIIEPKKNLCFYIVGKSGCNSIYVECSTELECQKFANELSNILKVK
jgi:hypothetical protein